MYLIETRFEVAASQQLELSYPSPCQNLHGHNWIITVFCRLEELDENGMVIDFKKIKDVVHSRMDHVCLNDVFDFNPTAENIAKHIVDSIPMCYKAKVQESENNIAIYEK